MSCGPGDATDYKVMCSVAGDISVKLDISGVLFSCALSSVEVCST